jgi:16S rRNA (cytosine1402-N4)-methyltransferase
VTNLDLPDLSHQPVLYHEIIHALRPDRGKIFVDCTLGAGGHAWGLLDASKPDGCLLGLDVDPQAIELSRKNLSVFGTRATLIQESYAFLSSLVADIGWKSVDGILLDLGVSSMQLDTAERGFSFREDAPLDMRFDPDNPLTADELVNSFPEADLAKIIYQYGEENRAKKIANAITRSRPVETTGQLANIVAGIVRTRKKRIHPATRTFQALRIAVNRELELIEKVLPQTIDVLAPSGRIAVISYHSLEDRIVKKFIRKESQDCLCPPRQPICTCDHKAKFIIITRKPITPSEEEIRENPRARSARLRIAERKF